MDMLKCYVGKLVVGVSSLFKATACSSERPLLTTHYPLELSATEMIPSSKCRETERWSGSGSSSAKHVSITRT